MVLLDAHAYKYDHDLIFLSRKMFIGGLSWQTTPGNYAKQSLLWILINISTVVSHDFYIYYTVRIKLSLGLTKYQVEVLFKRWQNQSAIIFPTGIHISLHLSYNSFPSLFIFK